MSKHHSPAAAHPEHRVGSVATDLAERLYTPLQALAARHEDLLSQLNTLYDLVDALAAGGDSLSCGQTLRILRPHIEQIDSSVSHAIHLREQVYGMLPAGAHRRAARKHTSEQFPAESGISAHPID
jgi:hypothetical protein